MDDTRDNILEVRGVYKSYDSENVIFKGLNITVQRGTIYALLGPSGCGKTTILQCVLGMKCIDAGDITLKVKNKSQIGYMPQNKSLIGEISIKETLNYYGWIYNLKSHELEQRKKTLYSCLDIPPETSRIKDLSGGQSRRVSMCIALIHNPEFLILDEPTVGIDPILNQSIWQYLLSLSTVHKKTIILTTHYIEEARKSNKLGMMRGGVLVVEEEPGAIMEHYSCNTLEEVFIQLSHKQESKRIHESHQIESFSPPSPVKPKVTTLKDDKLISINGFIGFFLKNFYFLKYSLFGWVLLLFIPISSSISFQYTLGRSPVGITVGIINDELLHRHGNCDNFSNSNCFPASCEYVSLLQQRGIVAVPYNDIESARINTGRLDIYGFIHFSENFTESLYERIWNNKAPDAILEQSEINVWIDMTSNVIGNFLVGTLRSIYFDYLDNLELKCNWSAEHAKIPPIKFNEPVFGKSMPDFNEFSVPGMLLMLAFFLPVSFFIPILQDKREGIIERSLISGLTNLDMLAAYAAINMILFSVQTICNIIIFYGIYDHVFEGDAFLTLSLLMLVGISGMSFGLFVAVLCDRDLTALIIFIWASICCCIVCSLFWTPEGMHYLLKSVSWLLPLTLSAEAYRAITARSWTLSHPVVYKGFISSLSWTFFFCFAAFITVKIRKGMTH